MPGITLGTRSVRLLVPTRRGERGNEENIDANDHPDSGARENNLQNVDVEIPRNMTKMVTLVTLHFSV